MQTKKHSFIEANINTFVGLLTSLLLGYYILPYWGTEQSVGTALEITILYTAVSLLRNYIIRRIANELQIRNSKK